MTPEIWISGFHGLLDFTDSWISRIAGFHGLLDFMDCRILTSREMRLNGHLDLTDYMTKSISFVDVKK